MIVSPREGERSGMKLHSRLSDGMVLQRDAHVPIWGTAGTGEEIRVSFLGKTYSTAADVSGHWRRKWGSADLPFIYVQLANFGEKGDAQVNWAQLREEQRRSLDVTNTAMAVTIDVGEYNDLHPQDKKTVGQRLALCARKLAYGEEQLLHSGPMYSRMEQRDGAIALHFDHAGSGLIAGGGSGELRGFAVSGPDGRFFPAQAVISGSTVIVRHEGTSQPVHARYAWANNPAGANLYNREGLPASPFSTSGCD